MMCMRNILVSLVLWYSFTLPSYGELLFDWSKVTVPREVQLKCETRAKNIVLKFTTKKYAPEGSPADFFTVKDKITIVFHEELYDGDRRAMGLYDSPDAYESVIELDLSLHKKPALFDIFSYHELGHAYYEIIKYEIEHEKSWDEEHIAIVAKEAVLLKELGTKNVPEDIYHELMKCYENPKKEAIYYQRGPILRKWWLR